MGSKEERNKEREKQTNGDRRKKEASSFRCFLSIVFCARQLILSIEPLLKFPLRLCNVNRFCKWWPQDYQNLAVFMRAGAEICVFVNIISYVL